MAEPEPGVHVLDDERYAADAAQLIRRELERAIASEGRCRWALAGGSTPRPVYQHLAELDDFPWDKVDVFWSDERAVPPKDPSSNYKMTMESLAPGLERAHHVHRVPGESGPDRAAAAYEQTLGSEPIDVLLLGMGSDGHTASLFPPLDPEALGPRRVIATRSPVPPAGRVSFTLRTINESRSVVFLVRGAEKAPALAHALAHDAREHSMSPAARARPANGRLFWLLDVAAASRLDGNVRREVSTDGG